MSRLRFTGLALCAALGLVAVAVPASALTFTATLNGANERPNPVNTPATGAGSVILSNDETSIQVLLSWSGLTSNAILAHIHAPAGPNGTASPLIDLTGSIPPAPNTTGQLNGGNPLTFPVTAQQVADLKNGLWYLNVHSIEFPGGEIRGQLVPEPTTSLLLAAGLGGLAWQGRRRRAA